MKNPIKHIKHLVKDPVKTVAEAKARKKEILPWLLGFVGAGLLFGILGGAIEALEFLSMLTIIPVVGIMFFGFLYWVAWKAQSKFAALTCNGCKRMYDMSTDEEFDRCVSYTIIKADEAVKEVKVEGPNNTFKELTIKAVKHFVLEIVVKCPHCGEEKTLVYKIDPFQCEKTESHFPIIQYSAVKPLLEKAVRDVLAVYDDPDRSHEIPFTIQSIHSPDHAEMVAKAEAGKCYIIHHPTYAGVKITYHRTIDELVRGTMISNELNGSISEKK